MIFITDADITDDVLVVDQSDIDAANAYVGSMQAKFVIADEDIADPLPITSDALQSSMPAIRRHLTQ